MMTRMANNRRDFILKVGILSGTIIGAGIFSLPYIFASVGLIPGLVYLLISSVVFIELYRMYAEVIVSTPGDHRLVGYARQFFGAPGVWFAAISSIVQVVFVLTIYLVLSQSFANLITSSGAAFHKLVLFWVAGSSAIFLGFRKIAFLETFITGGILAIIALIFMLGFSGSFDVIRIGGSVNWPLLLLPLGPVLFALSGRQAIPEVVKLGGDYKKAITFGTALPVVAYILFIIGILALSGSVTPDAVTGLIGRVSPIVLIAIGVMGALSLISSYITVGFDVHKSLEIDLGLPFWTRFFIIVFGPITLYLGGFSNFLDLVAFVGGLLLAAEAVFIMMLWRKATGKTWRIRHWCMLAVFVVAFGYEILK